LKKCKNHNLKLTFLFTAWVFDADLNKTSVAQHFVYMRVCDSIIIKLYK